MAGVYLEDMDEELPDYTMCLPFPTLPEELPEDFAARLQAAIAAFQKSLREQGRSEPPS